MFFTKKAPFEDASKLVIMSLRGIANGDAVAISRKGTALFNKVSVPGDSHASLGMTWCFARDKIISAILRIDIV